MDTDLIPTRGWLPVTLVVLVLMHLFEKWLYWPGTDECYWTAQHSSTMGSINMPWHQLQGSSQQTKDNNTDILCINSHEMPLHRVEHLKSSYVSSALNPSTDQGRLGIRISVIIIFNIWYFQTTTKVLWSSGVYIGNFSSWTIDWLLCLLFSQHVRSITEIRILRCPWLLSGLAAQMFKIRG